MTAITHLRTGRMLYEGEGTLRDVLEAAVLAGANLARANLASAYLGGAYLGGAYLAGAYLAGANLASARLAGANLAGANLAGANLTGANLTGANLGGANLASANLAGANLARARLADGTVLPDGCRWQEYRLDHLAGICDSPQIRAKALAAWGRHTWEDCPTHAAYGWGSLKDVPTDKRITVAAWIALYDAGLLEKPANGKQAA